MDTIQVKTLSSSNLDFLTTYLENQVSKAEKQKKKDIIQITKAITGKTEISAEQWHILNMAHCYLLETEKNNKMHINDDTKKIVHTFDTMTKNEYTGINGIANTILNKKFGNKWYEKNILPQIHEFISTYSKKLFVPINNKNIIFHLFGLDIMIDKEFKIKILEINIYPTHFLSGYREVYDEKYVSKLFSPPNQMEKLHEMLEYEEQFLDEIFHYTLDNIYPTKYSPKLKYLVKI